MRSPLLLLLSLLAACAPSAAPVAIDRPASVAPSSAPVAPPAVPSATNASKSAHSWPIAAPTEAADWYVHDVWVVADPPSAVFLLARFAETDGPDCEARLLAHARGLGANRLYVDRTQPCSGAAYTVKSPQPWATSSRSARPGAGPRNSAEISRWVRARWKRPASITEAEAERLCAVVQFSVSPVRRVWSVRAQPIQSSGNRDFDESVRAALESAIDEHATVPAPPDDFVGDYVDYRVEVSGGGACPAR